MLAPLFFDGLMLYESLTVVSAAITYRAPKNLDKELVPTLYSPSEPAALPGERV